MRGAAMKRTTRTLVVFTLCAGLVCISAASTPSDEAAVGVITKVVPQVDRMDLANPWSPADKGELLSSGDRLRTGSGKSLAIIKFKDKSFLRMHENSELTLSTDAGSGAFQKDVSVIKGVMGFQVEKQRNGDRFRFTSPTSVASIRGTRGLFVSSSAADTLIVSEGLVRMTNTVSGDEVDVPGGFAGLSYPDGSIQVRPATGLEIARAEEGSRGASESRKLEFDLRNGDGSQKKLKIEFDEP